MSRLCLKFRGRRCATAASVVLLMSLPAANAPAAFNTGSLSGAGAAFKRAQGENAPVRSVQFIESTGQFFVDDVIGEPAVPFPVNIQVPSGLPENVLIAIRGLPETFTLSAGTKNGGIWVIPMRRAYDLEMTAPPAFDGNFEIEVYLLRGREAVSDVRKVWVDIGPKRQPAVAATEQAAPQAAPGTAGGTAQAPAAAGAPAPAGRIASNEEQSMLKRAEGLLRSNDIAAARLIYTRLANRGSVQGAMLMAQSFDPAFLSRFNIAGLQPDMEAARRWYAVAAELGSEDASRRLIALSNSPPRQ